MASSSLCFEPFEAAANFLCMWIKSGTTDFEWTSKLFFLLIGAADCAVSIDFDAAVFLDNVEDVWGAVALVETWLNGTDIDLLILVDVDLRFDVFSLEFIQLFVIVDVDMFK